MSIKNFGLLYNNLFRSTFGSGGDAFGSGGDPLMNLGVNLGGINSYSGLYPFSNIMYSTGRWEQRSGSGAFTQDQGSLTATVGTDEFRLYLSDSGLGLPAGTYTVYNPSGAEIGVGAFGSPTIQAYTTATSFTFAYTSGGLFLHLKGSLGRGSGNLAIILPGQTTTWLAGDPFNSAFISFHQGLGAKVLRFMDWGVASNNIETVWADRTDPAKINFNNPCGGNVVPYELMFDLANRLGADPWICVPPRADATYVTNLAALAATDLDAGRKYYTERGNETWNSGYPWGDGVAWITYLDHTRRTATANFGADTYTLTGHGITNGVTGVGFSTKENRTALASDITPDFRTRHGGEAIIEVIDANTFRLRVGTLGGAIIPVAAGQVNYNFVVKTEGGKVANAGEHNAELCLSDWDKFDAALGVGRVEHIITGQAVNTSVASGRLTTSALARADSISPAPYFDTFWYGSAVDISTGQLLPKFWAKSNCTAHVGIYANGSTPSIADVIAGTGAINKQTIAYTSGASTYTNGVAVTGLTNGTTYSVQIVAVDSDGFEWASSGNATVSASTSTVNIFETYAQMAKRAKWSALVPAGYVQDHKALAPSKRVICYEGGSHDNQVAPAAVATWKAAYWEDALFGEVVTNYLQTMAGAGASLHCYFSDASAAGSVFALANTYLETTDERYQAFAALNGVARGKLLALSDLAPADISTEPSYPSAVTTFANASLTYSIFNGDNAGNFSIVGNELRIINGTGINWAVPTTRTLVIAATDGTVTDYFDITFATGDAWYASDALFAWDSVTDLDNAQMDPAIGSALARVTGAGATIGGGLWDMDGNVYYSASGMITALDRTKPVLIAHTIDEDNHTTNFIQVLKIGNGFQCALALSGSNQPRWDWAGGATAGVRSEEAGMTGGKKVYWTYFDPAASQVRAGINQTENTTSGPVAFAPSSASTADVRIGSDNATARSSMKHGKMQIVNRTGLTLADAKALVQKQQTADGI